VVRIRATTGVRGAANAGTGPVGRPEPAPTIIPFRTETVPGATAGAYGDTMSTSPDVLPTRADWQERVRTAMTESDPGRPHLAWERVDDAGRWNLAGACPHCGDPTSKLVSGRVVVSDTTAKWQETGALVSLMVECACDTEHRPGRRGCGAGRGFNIAIAQPPVRT
jgi:hypothetical protein